MWLCKLVFGILLLSISSNALYGADDPVTILTEKNFDEFISQPGVNVVKFFASWCVHCENFAPKFKKTANVLKGVVHFGVVDNEAYGSIGNRFKVEGYPTVLVFRSDKSTSSPTKYTGPRTPEGFAEFLMKEVQEVVGNTAQKEGVKVEFGSKSSCDSSSTCSGSGSNQQQRSGSGRQQQQGGSGEAEIELTDDNFDSMVLQSDDDWLVAFIAPWCGHCQNLKPQWKRAAEQLKGKVKVGTVDATVNTKLAEKYQIRGFPTIKYFKLGKVEEYDRGRSAEDIVAYGLEKHALNRPPPEVKEITSNDILHESCDNKQLCIIAFLPQLLDCQSKCRNKYLDVMKKSAEKHKSNDWGWLWSGARTHKELEDALNVGGFGYPALITVNMRKQKYAVMHGSFSVEGIRDFLHELGLGRASSGLHSMASLPEIKESKPWDGKDAKVVHEEEIDLSELGIKVEL